MPRILVVYYSLTGNTGKIAKAIAQQAGADLDEIIASDGRKPGFAGYVRSGWETIIRQGAPVRAAIRSPATYDLVVIGTPVWVGSMSSPVRTYLRAHRSQFKAVAAFCTEGGANGDRALRQIAEATGQALLADLIVTDEDLRNGGYRRKVEAFVRSLVNRPAATAA